jgi:type III pantothenate kinase
LILLVDAGNTRIKWGVRQAGIWQARGVCPTTEVGRLRAAWASFPLDHALLCCVADGATRSALADLLPVGIAAPFWVMAAAAAHGVCSRYQPPQSLGADRFVALVAARRLHSGPCLVVSVGTALTVDALTAEGEFLGGCIAPGPDLMAAALQRGTAGVRVSTEVSPDFPGSTGAAVATGIALAQAGVVAGMRLRLQRHCGMPVTVLLTGGARACLRDLLEVPLREVDDLVLEGLVWIAKDRQWEN